MIINYETNNLSADIFKGLRKDNFIADYEENDINIALNNTLFSVVVYDDLKPIGMGRVIGDNRIAFFLKDIVVQNKYRKKGVGTLIVNLLMRYIAENGCNNAYIGLMSTPSKEEFYKKFGFIQRPNSDFGHGMVKYLNKELYKNDK